MTTYQKINDRDWKRPDMRSIEGGVLADGLGCVSAGPLGTMGINTGPSLVGVARASGATSRYMALACAAILVVFSFVPKIAAVFLYPDRMESSAKGTRVTIRLYFSAG